MVGRGGELGSVSCPSCSDTCHPLYLPGLFLGVASEIPSLLRRCCWCARVLAVWSQASLFILPDHQCLYLLQRHPNTLSFRCSLADFQIEKKIGRGQFSEVYKATCLLDRKTVALKKVQVSSGP